MGANLPSCMPDGCRHYDGPIEACDCCTPIAPPAADVQRVVADLMQIPAFRGRIPVLVTGSNLFEHGKKEGKYLAPLVKAVAQKLPEDQFLRNRIVLVGASAHGGDTGKVGEAWDNVIQETFANAACEGDRIPVVKATFEDGPQQEGHKWSIIQSGSLYNLHICLPLDQPCVCDSSLPFRQGWKAALTDVAICFGGGPRARMLCGSCDKHGKWKKQVKDAALLVPAAGGMHHAELMMGDLKSWIPAGLSENLWCELKAAREGDIKGTDLEDMYASKVVQALREIVLFQSMQSL